MRRLLLWGALAGAVLLASAVGYKSWRVQQGFFAVPVYNSVAEADLSDLNDATLSHYYLHANHQDPNVTDVELLKSACEGFVGPRPFDGDGIAMVDYGGQLGPQYNPGVIALYALAHWELYLECEQPRFKDTFLKQADWLLQREENGKLYYRFTPPSYSNLNAPWVSGFAQGLAVSTLLRAYQSSGGEKYLAAAEKAFQVLRTPIDRGGAACKSEHGTWLEEYPDPVQPSHVFNGHVFALLGVLDYWRVTRDPAALELFQEGVAALKADLDCYDNGYWAIYDRSRRTLLSGKYMIIHIEQLRVLAAITTDPAFADYAAQWQGYRRSWGSFLRLVGISIGEGIRHRLGRG